MRHEVPQFIDIEDKIFGPLTFKQFVYVAGGLGLCYALYRFLPLVAAAPLILVVAGLAGALAFYKVNNRPFSIILQSALSYTIAKKLYLWQRPDPKERVTKQKAVTTTETPEEVRQKALSANKLQDVAWSLDILDTPNR